MLDMPVYLRPEGYRYRLRSNRYYGWYTGRLPDGRQLLVIDWRVLEFSADGDYLGEQDGPMAEPLMRALEGDPKAPVHLDIGAASIGAEAQFVEGPVDIRRFWLPEHRVGISDLPAGMREFYLHPETFPGEEGEMMREGVEMWMDDGQYAFEAGVGETYISQDGECLASPA